MNLRLLSFAGALIAVFALAFSGCSDDLLSSCGDAICTADQTCVANVCVDNSTECTGCTAGQHCVSGVCVDNYTPANVCDPLRQCRNGCGLSAACAAECEADSSAECTTCRDEITACSTRESCEPGSVNGCCETEFCACFPSAPGCGNVPDCSECQVECGSDTSCFNTCRTNSLACNLCLQPLDECQDARRDCDGAGDFVTCFNDGWSGQDAVDADDAARICGEQFCACLDADLEAGCQ